MTTPTPPSAMEAAMRDAIANAVQLIMVNPTGQSLQEDADNWTASSIDIGAFIETITSHANAVMADALAQAVQAERNNQRIVIDAYKVHHETSHPGCNITGPSLSPGLDVRYPPASLKWCEHGVVQQYCCQLSCMALRAR